MNLSPAATPLPVVRFNPPVEKSFLSVAVTALPPARFNLPVERSPHREEF